MSEATKAYLKFVPKYAEWYTGTRTQDQTYSIGLNLAGLVELDKTIKPHWFYTKLLAAAYYAEVDGCNGYNSHNTGANFDTMKKLLDTIYENDIDIVVKVGNTVIPAPSKSKGITPLDLLHEYFSDQGYGPHKMF